MCQALFNKCFPNYLMQSSQQFYEYRNYYCQPRFIETETLVHSGSKWQGESGFKLFLIPKPKSTQILKFMSYLILLTIDDTCIATRYLHVT